MKTFSRHDVFFKHSPGDYLSPVRSGPLPSSPLSSPSFPASQLMVAVLYCFALLYLKSPSAFTARPSHRRPLH